MINVDPTRLDVEGVLKDFGGIPLEDRTMDTLVKLLDLLLDGFFSKQGASALTTALANNYTE